MNVLRASHFSRQQRSAIPRLACFDIPCWPNFTEARLSTILILRNEYM